MTENQTLSIVISALREEASVILVNALEHRAGGDTVDARAHEVAAEALGRVADNIEHAMALGPDPEPYVGFSGTRYPVDETSRAALYDGPVKFEPRTDRYGPTEDER